MSDKEAKELRDTVKNLTASVKELTAINENLTAENKRLRQKLERMNELLLNAQRARFGQSSEKRKYVLGDGEQLLLFNEAEQVQDHKAPEPTEEEIQVAAHKRKRKAKETLEEKIARLPVKEVLLEMDQERLRCDKCGGQFVLIGKKFVRQEMVIIPQQEMVIKYYACTYACKQCEEKTGYAHLIHTNAPPPLMKHSLASPSTVADVMAKKYVDGLPLARQEKIWAREGVSLSRATLANWVIQCSQTWLKLVYRHLKRYLLADPVIHADETVVQVLKEEGKAPTSESRMWVYASSQRSGTPIRYFEYQPSRSGKHAAAFLKGFNGCLVTDGYSGYHQVEGVTHCGCWAHMKRRWREAMPKGATKETSKAAVGYEYCNKLFALEKKYAKLSAQERKYARQAMAEPLLEAYWLWLKTVDPTPGSKLADAVTYATNQRDPLTAFLTHGEVDISNNLAENAIRPFVVGRKNWLFCDTVKGAESSAIVYTLVETAKANGFEPYAYLLRLLTLLPYLGKSPGKDQLDALMPWNPALRQAIFKQTELSEPTGDL